MPSSSDEQRARWGIPEDKALAYLFWHGWMLDTSWDWYHHYDGQIMVDTDCDALVYLQQEWDYGGLTKTQPERNRLGAYDR